MKILFLGFSLILLSGCNSVKTYESGNVATSGFYAPSDADPESGSFIGYTDDVQIPPEPPKESGGGSPWPILLIPVINIRQARPAATIVPQYTPEHPFHNNPQPSQPPPNKFMGFFHNVGNSIKKSKGKDKKAIRFKN